MFSEDDADARAAFERLKAAVAAKPDPEEGFDESRLIAFAEGRLSADDAEDVTRQLLASPTLRAFLVDLRTPPSEADVAWATRVVTAAAHPEPSAPIIVDPFAPSAPAGPSLRLEGPFGGRRAVMDADEEPSLRFGPESSFALVAHGSPSLAFVAPEGGAITLLPEAAVSVRGDARRISGPARTLFPSSGRWHVGFVAGVAPGDLTGLSYAEARGRFGQALWRVVAVDVDGR